MEDLKGKAVLITGSSTGIGAAVAEGFARRGSRVAVHCASSRDAAEAVVDTIRTAGGEAILLQGDVTETATVTRLVDETRQAFGRIDVLINNAGGLVRRAPLAEIDDPLIDQIVDLNIRSAVTATRLVAPLMADQGGGAVINTGSIAARNGGGPGASLYAASKAFLQTFTRNIAREYGTRNVRVNAVAPGVITTPFHERFSTPEVLESMRQSIPMQRLGTPEECVGTYLFLASETLSGYVTGQVIEVNGGQLMP